MYESKEKGDRKNVVKRDTFTKWRCKREEREKVKSEEDLEWGGWEKDLYKESNKAESGKGIERNI